jgi:hypothetical protein
MTDAEAKTEIKRILEKEPCLCADGFLDFHFIRRSKTDGVDSCGFRKTRDEYLKQFSASRKTLENDTEVFIKACKWLESNIIKIKTINKRHSSYFLKHIIESQIGEYVSNGVCIAAAIFCGFNYKKTFDDYGLVHVNTSFNMSNKSLAEKWNEAGRPV